MSKGYCPITGATDNPASMPDIKADDSLVVAPPEQPGLWIPDPATHKLTDLEIEQLELEAISDGYIGDYEFYGFENSVLDVCECGVDSVGVGGVHSSWCKRKAGG